MPDWKKLTNTQWSTQVRMQAKRVARLHAKEKDKKGDRMAKQTAQLLATHVEDPDLRTALKNLFMAAYREERYKAGIITTQ